MGTKQASFRSDLSWEQAYRAYLRSLGMWPGARDATDDEQKCGIDYVSPFASYEVKGVRSHYTRFWFEETSNKDKGTPGWALYSEADILDYMMCHNIATLWPWTWHRMAMQPLRKWFADHRTEYPQDECMTDRNYITVGRLVPVADLPASILYFTVKIPTA